MERAAVEDVLHQLNCRNAQPAWESFLREYGPLIYAVARRMERDPDDAGASFVYACEQLARDRCSRLRRFRTGGPASFETWLSAVTRNLCLDWRRAEFGRNRAFRVVARLSPLEQELFECRYRQGFSAEEAWEHLHSRSSELTRETFSKMEEHVASAITARHAGLLEERQSRAVLAGGGQADDLLDTACDAAAGPEALAAEHEAHDRLLTALDTLPARERLVLQLRFVRGLTLAQAAKLAGLPSPQAADRCLASGLARLRKRLK